MLRGLFGKKTTLDDRLNEIIPKITTLLDFQADIAKGMKLSMKDEQGSYARRLAMSTDISTAPFVHLGSTWPK
jgi:hypothetical protein